MAFQYCNESPFWYFLAHQALAEYEPASVGHFAALSARMEELEVPVWYGGRKSLAWAVVCRLFNLTHQRAGTVVPSRYAYSMMHLGFSRAVGVKRFSDEAFQRTLGNIREPAFEGRTPEESTADTFLANGLNLTDPEGIPQAFDNAILTVVLSDSTTCELGAQIVRPSEDLWRETVDQYQERRPGVLRRQFTRPDSWLFP